MLWDEMNEAVRNAKTTLRIADTFVGQMANMIAGRLRSGRVRSSTLETLKRELRDYDMRTGTWKE